MDHPAESETHPPEGKTEEEERREERKRAKLEQIKKLKDQYSKVSRYNMKAVELEAKRLSNDSYAKGEARREWKEAQEKERKERRLRGITEQNSHLLETAEVAQKRDETKKEKEKNRVRNYGWNIFSDDAIYRGYEKRLKNLPTTPESAAKAEEEYDSLLDYGTNSRLSEEAINRVVADQQKQNEKHSKFSKRRTFYNQETVDYINERNRNFNKKLGRYYDRFTQETRANLERGTAL